MRKALKMLGCLLTFLGCLGGKAIEVPSDSSVPEKVTITCEQYDYECDYVKNWDGKTEYRHYYWLDKRMCTRTREYDYGHILTDDDMLDLYSFLEMNCVAWGGSVFIRSCFLTKEYCIYDGARLLSGTKLTEDVTVYFFVQ